MCALVSELIAVGALSKLLEKGSGRVGERKDRDSYVLHLFQTLVPRFWMRKMENQRLEDQSKGQSCSQSST